jgi:hypothetical protein
MSRHEVGKYYQSSRRNILVDMRLHQHRCDNLKLRTSQLILHHLILYIRTYLILTVC